MLKNKNKLFKVNLKSFANYYKPFLEVTHLKFKLIVFQYATQCHQVAEQFEKKT